MKTKSRYLKPVIEDFLHTRMVFVGGPRQVGKTTMCLSFLNKPDVSSPAYLNWDTIETRTQLRKGLLPPQKLLVIDEIHKYKLWRNLVKGFYDKNKGHQNYIITGSARLDYYRKGGDSLLGRYRYLRLHPFSISELGIHSASDVNSLLQFGGFPEPFLAQSDKNQKLWCKERLYRIVNDDIADLESLRDYSRLELLAELMNSKVGSLLSLKSLEEDLQVSQKTVAHWVDILERVYYLYRIYPFGNLKIRALKKTPKVYLWDWGEVESPGAKFENMVASHLLKYCHYLEDTEGEKMELRYIKDADQREVDFVVIKNKAPLFAVECKTGESSVSKSLLYFKERFKIPIFYQVHMGKADFISKDGVRVLPFSQFCKEAALV